MPQVTITNKADKSLKVLMPSIKSKVIKKILELQETPFLPGYKKLKGTKDVLRVRVGDYRILYLWEAEKSIVTIIRIAYRKEVYKDEL